MQNSNYGESVKFYEKINQLHGQLKNYEEEQFTLEAEFDRLCVMETRRGNVDTVAVSESNNNAAQHNNNIPSTSFLSAEQGKFEDSNVEDRRRRRNDEILRKIKELEANASLFAARSEKLRIMRSQYETLVRKYMATRSNNKSLLMASKPTPSLTSAYSFLNNNINNINNINAHVSIGVNTNISIEPEPSTDKMTRTVDYNSSINNNVIDGDVSTTPHENQKIPFQIQQQQQQLSATPNIIKSNPTTFSNGHLFNNNNNNGYENDEIFKTSENPNTTDFIIKPLPLTSKYTLRQNSMMDSDRENEGRLRHNHYFDLSTTSESDLTSLGIRPTNNNTTSNKNKPKMILPLNYNFDDTTQSDNTASLSITMPSKLLPNNQNTPSTNLLNYKKIKVPQLPISLTNTTTTSEISTINTTQSHQHNKKQQTREKTLEGKEEEEDGTGKRRIPVAYYLDEAELGRGIIDNDQRVDDTQVDIDNDDELDMSEGLTTSPGDSVMDSVQNRTLNESLPRENLLETTTKMMVMKDETTTIAAANNTTTGNKVIEENSSKAKEEKTMDRFLVKSTENIRDKDEGTEKASKLVYYGMKISSSTPEKNSTTIAMTSKTDEATKTIVKTNNIERNVTGAETNVDSSQRRESLNQIKRIEGNLQNNIEKRETFKTVTKSSVEKEIRTTTTIIGEKVEQEKGVEDPWENNTFSIGNKTKLTNQPQVEMRKSEEKELPVLTEPSKDNNKLPSPTQPKAPSSSTSAVVPGSGSRRVRLKFDDYDSDSDSIQQAVNPRKKLDGAPSGNKPQLSLAGGTGKNQVDVTDDDEDSFFD